MTCKKAIGVAKTMEEKYGEKLKLNIYTTDSEEAKKYQFKSSTNVIYENKLVPIDIATDRDKMDIFLAGKI
jgi:hypothetical protein